MKIKISKILLVLSVCGLLYSCDKFFEVDLKAQMDEEKVVNNEDYLARLWAGLYWAMENGFTAVGNGGYASACDEADNNQQSSSVQKFNTGSWNAQSNPDDLYSQFYQAIRSANDFLRLSDTVNNPQYTFREYEKGEPEKYATKVFNWHAYRLDASFLKAYYHFELWKRYGDIAIADKLLTESEALALERTPGQEVVEYIVHALDSLAPMYDELETMKNTQYTNGKWIDNQYGRITKGAVLALKARVLLYAASLLPHGIFELPALILAFSMGLYICGHLTRRCRRDPAALPLGACLGLAARLLVFLLLPLLILAALTEAYVTPLAAGLFL